MSILTFLFFASALYFATADEVPSEPIPDFQNELKQLLDVVNKGIDEYFSSNPVLNSLPVDDQEYLKAVIQNGFADYTNYVTYIANGEKDFSKVDNEDIIFRFETLQPFFSGIPFQPLPELPPASLDKEN